MRRSALSVAVMLLAAGAALAAGTYPQFSRGQILIGTPSITPDVYPTIRFGATQTMIVRLDKTNFGDPNNISQLDICFGFYPMSGTGNITFNADDRCWYNGHTYTTGNANILNQDANAPVDGSNNSWDDSAHPIYVNVRATLAGDDPNKAPWASTFFWRELQPDDPNDLGPSVPTTDPNLGTAITPIGTISTNVRYADPSTANTTGCLIGTPCTMNAAVGLISGKGWEILAATGTYNINGGPTLVSQSGDARYPIVIKCNGSVGSCVLHSTSGSAFVLGSGRAYWVLDGFKVFCDGCGSPAIQDNSSLEGNAFRNLVDDPSSCATCGFMKVTQSAGLQPAQPLLLENITLTRGYTTTDIFDFTPAIGPITARNVFIDNQGANASHFMQWHGNASGGGGGLVEGSTFRNATGLAEGALTPYLASYGLTVRHSLFKDLPIGVEPHRTRNMQIYQNTFYNVDRGVSMLENVTGYRIVGNIFVHHNVNSSRGISISVKGETVVGNSTEYWSRIAYNAFCGMQSSNITFQNAALGKAILGVDTSVSGGGAPAGYNLFGPVGAVCGAVSDPNKGNCGLTDPNNNVFSIDPNGPCVHASDPNFPSPTGHSGLPDIGAVQSGATGPPYAGYNQFSGFPTVASLTPTLSFGFVDPQNLARTTMPLLRGASPLAAAETVGAIRLQVDASPYFNSVSDGTPDAPGHPLLDTEWVGDPNTHILAWTTGSFTLNPANALTGATCYYSRFAAGDNVDPNRLGAFSGGWYKWCTQ